jgi:hypothetical protein
MPQMNQDLSIMFCCVQPKDEGQCIQKERRERKGEEKGVEEKKKAS